MLGKLDNKGERNNMWYVCNELKKKVTDIARRYLHIETLEEQNSDRLDFHECSVVALRDALTEAFNIGYMECAKPKDLTMQKSQNFSLAQRPDWLQDVKIKLDEASNLIRSASQGCHDDEMHLLGDELENLATDANALLSRLIKLC